jgi:hypothetical protein
LTTVSAQEVGRFLKHMEFGTAVSSDFRKGGGIDSRGIARRRRMSQMGQTGQFKRSSSKIKSIASGQAMGELNE